MARKLKKQYLLDKTLVGMRSGSKVWCCPIGQLPIPSQEYIGAQYELFIQRRTED